MATAEKLNIHQRLLAITHDATVAKGGTAPGAVGGFAFHKIDDVEAVLKPLFVKHGVTALPNVVKMDFSPNGGWNHADATVEVTFYNVDDPKDLVTLTSYGQGFDKQDKGAGKAISYATKNLYLSTFHLKGQPDNESDASDDHVPAAKTAESLDPSKYVTFGKNEGKPWASLSVKQLKWYADNAQDSSAVKAAQAEIARRESDVDEILPPSSEPDEAELF